MRNSIKSYFRGGSWRVGWTSDNWFMRPTTSSPTNTSQSQARSMRQRYDTPETRFPFFVIFYVKYILLVINL